jgi:hypothetical protein
MRKYTDAFYLDKQTLCLNSARQIVPWLLQKIQIKNVIDVGCGNGLWLSIFLENNIKDIHGYDGKWVDKSLLAIPAENFQTIDLCNDKFDNEKADLVISLEVAEHLPESLSDQFVLSLTKISSIILFSAAIPGQGGTNHINEQWPTYWIKKFEKYGFIVNDCIRKNFWGNEKVESWYKQNTFLFIKEDELNKYQNLNNEALKPLSFDIVHPSMFENKIKELTRPENYSLKLFFKNLPKIIYKKISYKYKAQ